MAKYDITLLRFYTWNSDLINKMKKNRKYEFNFKKNKKKFLIKLKTFLFLHHVFRICILAMP